MNGAATRRCLRHALGWWLMAGAGGSLHAAAATPEALQARLAERFAGDRSGACVVAAVVEGGHVARGQVCALPRKGGGPGPDSVFEIGSVSKTMTAFLVADLIGQGRWSLNDPLARHLPPGTAMPRQGEREILVRDVLTHTSGLPRLPPGWRPADPADPYADLGEAALLASLGAVRLEQPIGSRFEYSNFAMMLLSVAVARSSGGDFEGALTRRLFVPLRMDGAHVQHPRSARPLASGHAPGGQAVPGWHAAGSLAGVGMVRATLDDLVRYAQAHLGQADAEVLTALRLTQQPLQDASAMAWIVARAEGRSLLVHEGATGGFSSLIALEPDAQRAVVILADTALGDLGGLGDLGRALLGLGGPPLRARRAATPDAALLAALPGDWSLGGLTLRIWREGDGLMAQADGQPAWAMKYDSAGDFHPEGFSALLTPLPGEGPLDRALWRQGGGVLEMTRRRSPDAAAAAGPDPRWRDFAGEYRLMPQFSLRVFEEGGVLKLQGSGQPALTAELAGPDTLAVKAVGAVVEFKRDAAGRVVRAVLRQGGQVIEGPRQGGGPTPE